MLNQLKKYAPFVAIATVFVIMLGFLIKDTIKFNNENAEYDTIYVDTTYVIDSNNADTLEIIEIDSTLINSNAVD